MYLRGNLRVRLATQRKPLRKFNLRPPATTCRPVLPGLKSLNVLETALSLFNAVRNSRNGCHLFHYASLNKKPQARTDLNQFTFASSYWDRTERCSRKKNSTNTAGAVFTPGHL